jgi:hypothetical protein
MSKAIDKFFGEHRFLSNFWPCTVFYEGDEYPSVEHAYVAAKTTDREVRKQIQEEPKAGAVKKLGRQITLRTDWEDIKLEVMESLVTQKFTFNTDLREKLLSTGDSELVEGNTWGDTFWGVCKGEGQNNLGKILMKVRKNLND